MINLKYCECGCGTVINNFSKHRGEPARFVHGHNTRVNPVRGLKPLGHKIKSANRIIIKTDYGYELEHRFIMSKILGRPLTRNEVVHHKDRNPMNNNPDNLKILQSQKEHIDEHTKMRDLSRRRCSVCNGNTSWNKTNNSARWVRSKITGGWLCNKCIKKEYRLLRKRAPN